MIEEIFPNLYRIEIPLPASPLKALNSYLIRGQGRFVSQPFGETLAHLKYLEEEGVVREEIKENTILFSLA